MATEVRDVFCFGDSGAAGAGNPARESWATMLQRRFYGLNPDAHRLQNTWFHGLWRAGETAQSLLPVVAPPEGQTGVPTVSEYYRRLRPGIRSLAVVAVGGSQLSPTHPENAASPEKVRETMRHVAWALLQQGDLLYVGMPAPDLARLRSHSPTLREQYPDTDAMVAEMERYEAAAMDAVWDAAIGWRDQYPTAPRYVRTIPLFVQTQALLARSSPLYHVSSADHCHPSLRGHRFVYEAVVPAFEQMLLAPSGTTMHGMIQQ